MKRTLLIIITLLSCVGLTAQDKDSCIKKFYAPDNELLQCYTASDTMAIKNEADLFYVRRVIQLFSSEKIVASVNALKADSLLNRFHSKYVRTEATDGINLKDYVEIAESIFDKRNFFKHTKILDTLTDSLISRSDIVHISVFYFNPVLESELYLYERGARMADIFEFRLNRIYNSPLMNPIYPYEETTSKTPYCIGIEQRTHTYTLVIPLMQKGDVSFNVQLVICRKSTPSNAFESK